MWLEDQTLNCKFLITLEHAPWWHIVGLHYNCLMDLKFVGFLSLGGARTLCDFLFGLHVLEILFKDGRFYFGFGLLPLQPGYLVSQFLNLLLLDPDNLNTVELSPTYCLINA